MRVRRLMLGVALLAAAGALVLDMSGRAPRLAGTDHVGATVFVATLPHGGTLCQPAMSLPSDTRRIEVLLGTYGAPRPAIWSSFRASDGRTIASGELPAGTAQGKLLIPLRYAHGPATNGTLCLHAVGKRKLAFAGEPFGAGVDARAGGRVQAGRISVYYYRPGRESWWQLLGVLDERFGLGKAPFFGDWTLPAMALLLLGVWIATARLLLKELT
jgi:hypothetical protein